jgi:hypothetical protein
MKYSLRSLMIATVVLPPLLAAGWFACTMPTERAIPVAQWLFARQARSQHTWHSHSRWLESICFGAKMDRYEP